VGILGNLFSAQSRRRARKKERRIRRMKERHLGTIRELTGIKHRLQDTSLAERLHLLGQEDSTFGDTAKQQLELGQLSETQQLEIAGQDLDLLRYLQKAEDIQANMEGIDAVIGVALSLLGGGGGDQQPTQRIAAGLSQENQRAATIRTTSTGAAQQAIPQQEFGPQRDVLGPGQFPTSVVGGRGTIAATPSSRGFETGATQGEPTLGRRAMSPSLLRFLAELQGRGF